MTIADRWLLPDGVAEILPAEALQIEKLRRQLLDLYRQWGYQLVIPPLVEFTDSLLIGMGKDLDLLTFKVVDQLSGRTLGIRADFTPQTARIDAHSMKVQGANRLCYAGHVLYTKPRAPLATRSPIKSGVELYGEPGLGADLEVVSLLQDAMQTVGLTDNCLEIGHVGIFRSLTEAAKLSVDQCETLFELLGRKAVAETRDWVSANITDTTLANIFQLLPSLAGDRASLDKAKVQLKAAPAEVLKAIDALAELADTLTLRFPNTKLYFDLSEPHSFNYQTGIVFSVFANGYGRAVASGGRYDEVGQVFGRARPATGFSIDITALNQLLVASDKVASTQQNGIYVWVNEDPLQWQAIQNLRQAGEVVVCGYAKKSDANEHHTCERELKKMANGYQVVERK